MQCSQSFKNILQRTGGIVFGIRYFFKVSDRSKEYKALKLIGFSNIEIYTVVADVKNYEKFLPFCNKSTILKSSPGELQANLEIGFPPIVENYDSIVYLKDPNSVQAVCSNGKLFIYLETTWIFHPGLSSNPRSCLIDFTIRFQFKSKFYSHVASVFFDKLVQQMENAFLKEALRRYGKPSLDMRHLHLANSNT